MLVTLALFSATVALLLSFIIASKASMFGYAVAVRFLERGNVIPPDNEKLTAENLEQWRLNPRNREAAHGYGSQIMRCDMAFLVSLGLFFGSGSAVLAGPGMSIACSLLLWIFPALYMISDFTEDILIERLLCSDSPPAATFTWMRRATAAKIATSIVSFVQLLVLSGWSALR